MSDATYRIDTEHKPGEMLSVRWVARIIDIAGESWVYSTHAATEERAMRQATEWIAAQSEQQRGSTLYVDEFGQPVEHSVKA